MVQDEIGMNTEKVEASLRKIDYYIQEEKKLKASFNGIISQLKTGYDSDSASVLHEKETKLIEAEHSKDKNINSYKNYIEKYLRKYSNISNDVIDIINNKGIKKEK